VLAQIAGLKLKGKTSAPVLRDDDGNIDLSQKYDKDGTVITEWLSALIDAHVDLEKDTYIIDLNVNASTYSVITLLLRSGAGKVSFDFLSQPILKQYAEQFLRNRGRLGRGDYNIFESLNIELGTKIDELVKEDTDTESLSLDVLRNLWDETSLLEQIEKFGKGELDLQYYWFQREILNVFQSLELLGQFLFEATSASQVDTKRYGKNFSELRAFVNVLKKVYKDNRFINFDKILPYEPQTGKVVEVEGSSYLGEMFRNAVLLPLETMSEQMLEATDGFADLHDSVRDRLGLTFTRNSGIINDISNQIYSFLSARFFADEKGVSMTPGRLEALLLGDKNIMKQIRDIKQGQGLAKQYPELQKNQLIKYLNYTYIEDDTFESFITISTTKASDKFAKDTLTMAWEDLFEHKDEAVQAFAKNLVVFSYYTSGFKRGIFSFYHYIPPHALKEMRHNDDIISYNDFIKTLFKDLASNDSEKFRGITDEIIKNNWFSDTFVARPRDDVETKSIFAKDQETILVSKVSDRSLYIGTNKFKQHIYKPYVLLQSPKYGGTQLMRYVGYDAKDNFPIYVAENKFSYYNRGILV